jgi:hypothetical protein
VQQVKPGFARPTLVVVDAAAAPDPDALPAETARPRSTARPPVREVDSAPVRVNTGLGNFVTDAASEPEELPPILSPEEFAKRRGKVR